MTISVEDLIALEILESRLRTILPIQYQDSYEDLMPVAMGSAPLKYDLDGRVAWNEIWATFCDLAMAGGPPHRGNFLASPPAEDIEARPDEYRRVAEEISRGIGLITGLTAHPASDLGWVKVVCHGFGMAAWLVRAIVMENVVARHGSEELYLPAGPDFRLEKEIKNVITVVAKTCHYWTGHIPPDQKRSIEGILRTSDLLEPCSSADVRALGSNYQILLNEICECISRKTGLRSMTNRYVGWIGLACPSVRAAVWMMRAMVGGNILARREESLLFVPINPVADAMGERVVSSIVRIHYLASVKKIL
jgi:sirohydrochlorin cobaltochelatase